LVELDIARRRPVLVTGAHRSGTTWVGRILALSPEVGYINEPFNPYHQPGVCACRFPLWFQYVNGDNEHLFRAHLRATLTFRYRLLAQARHTRDLEGVQKLLRDGYGFARARLWHARPVMKDPIAAFSSNWLASTFGMTTIVLVRHPAAFASSLKRLAWSHPFEHFLAQPALMEEQLGDFEDEVRRMARGEHQIVDQAALLWRLIYSVLVKYGKAHRDWMFVRHEDLAGDPVSGFARIFERLGLAYTDRIQAAVRWYSSGARELEADAAPHAIRRASRQTIHGWRQRLSPAEQAQLRAQVEGPAREFYAASDW
jgi:Sulfotransferase family